MHYHTIVIGLGGMGSAAADTLASRGHAVLGLDRFAPPHDLGSTHGQSRIIRLAYMEHPAYVPLLRRAYELWHDLEESAGQTLLQMTGGLMIGLPESDAVAGSLASAREWNIEHELMSASEARERYPDFRIPDDYAALWDGSAGVLFPEMCIDAFLRRATESGADLRLDTVVEGWDVGDSGVAVRTSEETFRAEHLVVTAGAWAGQLLPGLARHLVPSREVMHWFQPVADLRRFAPDRFPIYMWEPPEGDFFYGFPAVDGPTGGVKIAIHHGGSPTDPDAVDREVSEAEVERMLACFRDRIPSLAGRWIRSAVCMYTNSPDEHFLIGDLPGSDNVHIAAGLSGHGFKFASVVGEILADLATEGGSALPLDPFAPDRFA